MKQATILHPHTATYASPIKITIGEEVAVDHEDTDNPGWVWCTDNRGKSGWVPKSILDFSFNGANARAFEDYDAIELTVRRGESVKILEEESGWFWCENAEGQHGWVPKECVT